MPLAMHPPNGPHQSLIALLNSLLLTTPVMLLVMHLLSVQIQSSILLRLMMLVMPLAMHPPNDPHQSLIALLNSLLLTTPVMLLVMHLLNVLIQSSILLPLMMLAMPLVTHLLNGRRRSLIALLNSQLD